MIFSIDPSLDVPPYEQIINQIVAGIRSKQLLVDTRLAPVRHLAVELGVSPGTVARAYKDLETAGILQTRGRNGTFVCAIPDTAQTTSPASLETALAGLIRYAHAEGITLDDLLTRVRTAFYYNSAEPNESDK
ncbi:GntR family transcriptional regulator [Arcanobacterium buesumense]|uniref:GntR family transcriptional regulator n=1 Tax=Arcanobacterium buesumense TaxID=2722751 RepID=A0A6H2EMB5_9ACTO|nr:GntR family transcriptional regulator [Arcanobacterium buesumense]QJC22216.1 GntR family transcriptional regulator [Arcanobacterium buesumense]